MRNLCLTLSYDGSGYHGWQMQKNGATVQGELADAIEKIFQNRATIYGCSRTDAGVHAKMFCCNFKTAGTIETEKVPVALNAYLPRDISVSKCAEAAPEFNARFDCKGKEYEYLIWNKKIRNPFLDRYALYYPYALDEHLLDEQAQDFAGTHDFSAFCAAGSTVADRVRTVSRCNVRRDGDKVLFTVQGNGFLYNMVRIMVGTLLGINAGKIPTDSIPQIISSGQRTMAGMTVPAQGLYLNRVFY